MASILSELSTSQKRFVQPIGVCLESWMFPRNKFMFEAGGTVVVLSGYGLQGDEACESHCFAMEIDS